MSVAQLKVYVGGEVVPADQPQISVFDAGFQSGDAVWEGMRVYNGRVFRLEQHLARLRASAHAVRLVLPLDEAGIAAAIEETLAANGMTGDAHIRLMVTRGSRSTSGMDPRNAPPSGTLVIVPEHKPVAPAPAPQRLRTASIRRPTPQVLDPSIHHSNQLNSILARLEILDEEEVDATLMLDTDGFVAEADTANVFCVTDGVLRTPVATACLHGITREIVLGLGRELGVETHEDKLTLFDLYTADEVFVTGTVCELVPVTTIDARPIGTGEPGPQWRRLLDAYRALVQQETAG
ncbi:aminotransferase class IV [Serinicoccus kebangsaanensis]|uniref:aminotransferase class IV n=1 Tax=Serinicoccus kebangsaanensis TaxID=2602069 RepID=UPI00124DE887|nr:aminotransferase class IV [Serinicoccus kebangsaanensis]